MFVASSLSFRFVLDIFRIEGRSEDSSLVDDIPLHAPDVMTPYLISDFLMLISQNWIFDLS